MRSMFWEERAGSRGERDVEGWKSRRFKKEFESKKKYVVKGSNKETVLESYPTK